MTEASQIKNSDTLEAWLKTRPREDALVIAHRVALRALPVWGAAMAEPWAQKADLTALPVLRAHLISAVAALVPTADIKVHARAAADAAAAAAARAAARAAAYAAADAAAAAYVAAYADAAAHAAAAYAAADAAAAAYAAASRADAAVAFGAVRIDAERLDAGEDIRRDRVWPEAIPNWFADAEATMLAVWDREPDPRWAFWRRWWEGAKTGRPLDPDLQLAIVKGIVEEDTWSDPDAVATRIVEIVAKWQLNAAIAANPHAWRISIDPDTHQFRAVEIDVRDMSEVIADTHEAIKDFDTRCKRLNIENFGQAVQLAFEPVIRMLKRDLKRFSDQPYKLFKALDYARGEMENISRLEGFAGESYLSRFFRTLDDLGDDICLAAPKVLETLKAKSAVRFERYEIDKRREMMQSVFSLHLDAEGILERAAFEALRTILDDTASDAQKKDAYYFCQAVLPRAARAYLAERDEQGGDPKVSEQSLLDRAAKYADALTKLDKGVDAFQENVPELYEGARSAIEVLGKLPLG